MPATDPASGCFSLWRGFYLSRTRTASVANPVSVSLRRDYEKELSLGSSGFLVVREAEEYFDGITGLITIRFILLSCQKVPSLFHLSIQSSEEPN